MTTYTKICELYMLEGLLIHNEGERDEMDLKITYISKMKPSKLQKIADMIPSVYKKVVLDTMAHPGDQLSITVDIRGNLRSETDE